MRTIILSILSFGGLLTVFSARADTLSEIRNNHTLSPQDRIVRLEALLANPNKDVDKQVIQALITDAKYEVEKRKHAQQMIELARKRIASVPDKDVSPFMREAIQLDALSIIQAIPFGWLSAEDQRWALELVKTIETESNLSDDNDANRADSNHQESSTVAASTTLDSIEKAIVIINSAVEKAKKENLSIIENAKANGLLSTCLQECESARQILMSLSPDATGTAREKWEAAMAHLGHAASVLRERQRLKYTLWAEGLYRETDPMNVSRKLDEAKAMELYRRLSEVNVSLVAEPSLSREITKRLYELYDSIDALKSKERVRYQAIRNLEKRKTLDDF
ncbi:MAG: hypothetical protein ACOX7Q_03125 [Kiritimatiellia bacterium]|jgi:hypothetical protein